MKANRIIATLLVLVVFAAVTAVALASRGSAPAHKAQIPARVHPGSARESTGEQPGESASESSAEPEAGQQGERAQGHEDAPGQDVNHECTGDCQE